MSKLSKHKQQERRLAKRVSEAAKRGNRKALHQHQRAYLSSHSCKVVAAFELGGTLERAEEIAGSIDLWTPCAEPAVMRPQLKLNGSGFRYIVSFGPENKSRQILVRNLLLSRFSLNPAQKMMQGGRDVAIQEVQSNFSNGFRFSVEVDIYRCYRSTQQAPLARYLQLPEVVVENVLIPANLNISLIKSYKSDLNLPDLDELNQTPIQQMEMLDEDWKMAQRGLTEGSKASPFAAELIFKWVLDNMPKEKARIVNYADNFLIQCESEHDAKEHGSILRELLRNHPAGPFQVNMVHIYGPDSDSICGPDCSFEFLGYVLRPDSYNLVPEMNCQALLKAKNDRKRIYELLGSKRTPAAKARAVNKLFKRQLGLYSGFHLWPKASLVFEQKLRRVVIRALKVGVPHDLLNKKVRSLIWWL